MIAIKKEYYTFKEAVNYLNLNHKIITTEEELKELAFQQNLKVGIYLHIKDSKVILLNHNHIEKGSVIFNAMNENQEDTLFSDEGFYNINLEPAHKLALFKHLPYTSQLYSQDDKSDALYLFIGVTDTTDFLRNQIRISHADLLAFIGEPIKAENKPLNEKTRTSYLNIIAALVGTLLEDKERFPSQNKLIEHLSYNYQGYTGLSEANLRDKFSQANNSLQNS